ncbi:MAG: hypothetical protein JXA74_04210 [Anaerolineae bacterium]|nr:hypothetical protein [Anaerolineae bacterium]
MKTQDRLRQRLVPLTIVLVAALTLAGCAAAPTATPLPLPTPTVAAQQPAPTMVPPTPVPPTAVPPTASAPAVATPMPQATAVPPTAAPAPPTDAPAPTQAPEEPAFVWQPDGTVSADEYSSSVATAGVTFHWRTDGEFLYGALSADTRGWVSVGFDPDQRMQGANYVYGWVKDGQAEVMDMFGTRPSGPNSHPVDTELGGQSHILAFGGAEAGGTTTIEFQIPLDSGDANDKPLAVGETHTILLAFGPGDDLSYHAQRGATEFVLTAE